ncbi:hypothetical protein, partial [Ruegeria sp. HKCCSA071]|uniref:hypothetical protein n=1 Tax=Ruegeria sp. HKCCSA071 TaxID=2794834 RepID=UPI001AE3D9C9
NRLNLNTRCPQSLLSVSTVFPVRQANLCCAGEGRSKYYSQNPQAENDVIGLFFEFSLFIDLFQ